MTYTVPPEVANLTADELCKMADTIATILAIRRVILEQDEERLERIYDLINEKEEKERAA